MAQWVDKTEFMNQNSILLQKRINNQYSTFLETKPSFATYYHINSTQSTVDRGLQTTASVLGSNSSIRYNKIRNFPVYLSETIDNSLNDEEQGLDLSYSSNCMILPHTIHPLPDDFFLLDYTERKFLFRITHVNYDTVKSNSFFRCEFSLHSMHESDVRLLESQVVKGYNCIFDNIGTIDRSLIADDEFELIQNIQDIRFRLRKEYLEKFRNRNYNALMYMRDTFNNIYDAYLNVFCNKNKVFEIDTYNTSETYLLYEEKRDFFKVEYENTFFDRLESKDDNDLDELAKYYDTERCAGLSSIFEYANDRNVLYTHASKNKIGIFGNPLERYLPANFINALELKDDEFINDNLEEFVFVYFFGQATDLKSKVKLVDIRRVKYNYHNYLFIPMVLYCLKKLYHAIMADTSVMDEALLTDEHMKAHTMRG